MNETDPIESLLSKHRIVGASPGLRERVLDAAAGAWGNAGGTQSENAQSLPGSNGTPWWQFAAAAAVVLFTGLNAVHSAANLTSARESAPRPIVRLADSEAEALADGIGFDPGEVKRMLILGSPPD